MKTLNPEEWSKIQSELKKSDVGASFLKFLEFWGDTAEKIHEENNSETSAMNAALCLREAFDVSEKELGGVNASFMSQMLALFVIHWVHSEQLVSGLTNLEMKLVQEALLAKIWELQEKARSENSSEDGNDVASSVVE